MFSIAFEVTADLSGNPCRYVIGDDDTMFSPLALAQLLLGERYPSDDEWCA
jgi:hypothetical protein